MSLRILTITFVTLLIPFCLSAQTQRITLEQAIQLALDNNYQLKQAENNLTLAEIRELSAKADFLPSLNANANTGRSVGRRFDTEVTGTFVDVTQNSFSAGASTGIDIFRGFANINNLRSAQSDTKSREELLRRARENVIFTTASAYLDYLLSLELLEIAEQNLTTSMRQLEQIKAQVEVGARPTVDLLNQESVVANNELLLITRENDSNFSRLVLVRRLQIDPLGDYQFIQPEIDESSAIPLTYDLNELIAASLEARADLRSEEIALQATEYQLKATRGSFYPTLTASASMRSSFNDLSQLSNSDQFFDQNPSRSFGLSLNIPIFNRLNTRTNVRAQEINYKNAQLNLENTRLQVVQEVNQAYNDYIARSKELDSSLRALVAAERAYETEQQRYEVGASTLIELSQSNANYVQAQSNRIQTVYRFIFQEKLLDYFIGRLDEDISFN